MSGLDAATVEVVRCYLGSAAEEMRRTLVRTAFNPVVYEVLDFGLSIYSADLDLVAEAPGLTFFLGANDYAIRKGVEYVGLENLEPGDIVLMNYPYWNSAHTLDVTLFAPVFGRGDARPFAFTCVRAHWMDLGAKDPGYVLDSTDMHQEGLIFPGTKVYRRGQPNREVLELIRFNSRMPDLVLGDLDAQVAATRTGERRLVQILEKFGRDTLDAAIGRILDRGERATRQALASLPRGSWTARAFLDGDGITDDLIPMQATVTLDGSSFHVDFDGSSPAVRGPVNVPFGRTETMCKVALKAMTSPLDPCNGGNFRPLRVDAQPGSLFHAVYPSPTFTLWTTSVALELVFHALAQGMPDRLAASSGGDVPGFMMVGIHPDTRRLFAVSNNDAIGWGATRHHDGANATNHLSQSLVRNTPIEVLELKTGMRIERLELRTDSGGAGQYRGGVGLRRDIGFVSEGEFLSVMKKTRTRGWALAGGHDTEPNGMLLFPDSDRAVRVGTRRTAVVAGDRVRNLTAGGCGYGCPADRDPARVLDDVLDGYVSPGAARDVYGVAVRDGRVDDDETRVLRAQPREAAP
jgi:N-methylhydantoinase B